MYKPSYLFDRTEEEKRDIFKSWERSDQAFFAPGACHILDELFVQLHQHENFKMVHMRPHSGFAATTYMRQTANGHLIIMAGRKRVYYSAQLKRHFREDTQDGDMSE